jgi:hypothetical protein
MQPAIGEPRIYEGDTIPKLYPGEVAIAQIDPATMVAAMQRGEASVAVTSWMVEPMPGWEGRWLRLRYRVWGRWFSTGPPRLQTSVTARTMPAQED